VQLKIPALIQSKTICSFPCANLLDICPHNGSDALHNIVRFSYRVDDHRAVIANHCGHAQRRTKDNQGNAHAPEATGHAHRGTSDISRQRTTFGESEQ